jgi:hypothetical protein
VPEVKSGLPFASGTHLEEGYRCVKIALAQLGMDPPPPGFDRVVISCRACGHADALDLQGA